MIKIFSIGNYIENRLFEIGLYIDLDYFKG